ncbi:alpha/beta hydrolase [Anopheles sinensis]|uniref:Alpha/beta hydrolase n=1 Tax=Anopheles sinensis TaxID=74873 RepID=A0A084VA90_ANOSI|nr:alpha/beta hydrolase [Anopheles sinensis]
MSNLLKCPASECANKGNILEKRRGTASTLERDRFRFRAPGQAKFTPQPNVRKLCMTCEERNEEMLIEDAQLEVMGAGFGGFLGGSWMTV